MSYLPFVLLGYLLNSIAVTIDKFLLAKAIPNPLNYVFYISLLSLLVLLATPFTHIPTVEVFLLASASTIFWTMGAYLMFWGLKVGQITRVIPVIATLTTLFLLIYAGGTSTITNNETWAAAILILGLIAITSQSWLGKINKKEMLFEILAASFFALSYILLKQAYLKEDFLTVLVWSRWVVVPLVIIATFFGQRIQMKLNKLFLMGQAVGATSQLLLTFSISLTSPALVNSLQAVQYLFLLIFGLIIFKEQTSKLFWSLKILGIISIFLGLFILALPSRTSANLSVSYSPKYARQLGLNPKLTFSKIVDDLSIKKVRLAVYWDQIQPTPDKFDFSSIDYYLDLAQKRDLKIILSLGYKQPRWPECFAPSWFKKLNSREKALRILELIRKEVEHFKNYPNIEGWQVENEPLFQFGECDRSLDRTQLLRKEVQLVRTLDQRPILLTDSGELSFWTDSIPLSDILGISLYRQVWNPYFGRIDYPLPTFFYTIKDKIIREVLGKKGQTQISELQAEPWLTNKQSISTANIEEQIKVMPVTKLKDNLNYARETGFGEIYLWGVEWWYFMAQNGHPQYLEFAKSQFRP